MNDDNSLYTGGEIFNGISPAGRGSTAGLIAITALPLRATTTSCPATFSSAKSTPKDS